MNLEAETETAEPITAEADPGPRASARRPQSCGARECDDRWREISDNLEIARASGWRTKTLESLLNVEKHRYDFYLKLRAALDAGYYIVPDMPCDVFAVRTTARHPNTKQEFSNYRYPDTPDAAAQELPEGVGENVSVSPMRRVGSLQTKNEEGEAITRFYAYNTNFADEIDFPFALARTEVLSATREALARKIFDEIAAVPQSRGGDPMVVGRLIVPGRAARPSRRRISFLITWFLDTVELR